MAAAVDQSGIERFATQTADPAVALVDREAPVAMALGRSPPVRMAEPLLPSGGSARARTPLDEAAAGTLWSLLPAPLARNEHD
jgi:hypothetical protein